MSDEQYRRGMAKFSNRLARLALAQEMAKALINSYTVPGTKEPRLLAPQLLAQTAREYADALIAELKATEPLE